MGTYHYYHVVTCKNPTCGAQTAVKYMGGEKRAIGSKISARAFEHNCPVCRRHHRYAVAETRVESYEFPPPPGWEDKF